MIFVWAKGFVSVDSGTFDVQVYHAVLLRSEEGVPCRLSFLVVYFLHLPFSALYLYVHVLSSVVHTNSTIALDACKIA